MQNGTAILEDKECVVSWKTKHTLTIWSSSCTPWYLPKGAENMSIQRFAHRCLWFIVHSLSCAQLFVTPWTAAHQASLSFTISWSFPNSCHPTISSSVARPPPALHLSQHQGLFHTGVYISSVHNCQISEAIRLFFSRWMDKWTVVYLVDGMLFGAKKKWAIKSWKDMEET